MAIPRQTAIFWRAMSIAGGKSTFQLPADELRRASDKLARLTRLPGAALISGKPNPNVFATEKAALLDDGRTVGLRVYRPHGAVDTKLPLIVNFHGGGFVSGDPYQSEWWCSTIADSVRAVVVSVDYRLAPEHPYPAAPQDCYDAMCWAVERAADLGADGNRLAVMGDSAGGNLAAVVSLMARDRSGPQIALQVLLYPGVEFLDTFPSEDENATAPVLGKADLQVWRRYCTEEQATEPYASPLRGNHDGLPPALIQTAQHDPLRDQGTAYAEALRASGVEVTLTNYVDAVHGYISIPGVVPAARQAVADAAAALRAAFGERSPAEFPGAGPAGVG
jgi:acetyl esterase